MNRMSFHLKLQNIQMKKLSRENFFKKIKFCSLKFSNFCGNFLFIAFDNFKFFKGNH